MDGISEGGRELRAARRSETTALLKLNNDHALELSELDPATFRTLLDAAWRVRVVGDADAMLIAFTDDSDWRSENIDWFRVRYPRFAYVDRIVVSPRARGQGLARLLYQDLIEAACVAGYPLLCAEVNLDPPNPASDALHRSFGFQPVGQAQLATATKSVTYYTLDL